MKFLCAMFVSTIALLTAVQSALDNARYTSVSGPPPANPFVLSTDPSDTPLFDRTAFYSKRNLARALEDLRIMQKRVCLIVPIGDSYAEQRSGNIAQAARSTEFMLVMADRSFTRDAKQLGVTLDSPGILVLKDLTVELLTKKSFLIEGLVVRIAPDAGAIVQMEWKEERMPAADTTGRECWNQIFRASAGVMYTAVGRV